MNKKQAFIVAGVILVTIPLILITVYVLNKPQDIRSRAAAPTPTLTQTTATNTSANTAQQAACSLPNQVQNVKVNYPNCQ